MAQVSQGRGVKSAQRHDLTDAHAAPTSCEAPRTSTVRARVPLQAHGDQVQGRSAVANPGVFLHRRQGGAAADR